MATDAEQPLTGGAQTAGVVRVGATLRRPSHARSDLVQALLAHLRAVGFSGAPRPLGYDEQGREVLAFVEGHVPHGLPAALSDAQLISATALIRAYHDASATFPGLAGQEVVCHGDLGPHDTVFCGEEAVAIIDWDAQLAPGRRVVDFAHAVWCFADLTEPGVPVDVQAGKVRLMCAAYPGMTPDAVVEELTARFHRARVQHAAAGRPDGVAAFDRLIAWMATHGGRITA